MPSMLAPLVMKDHSVAPVGAKLFLVGKCGHARGVHVGSPGKAYVYHGEARWPARVDAHRSAGVWLVGPCGVG